MCTFLFFSSVSALSISLSAHSGFTFSPFFFFGFLSLLATFFFLFVYFTSFFLFFFLAPFNSRFVFASFYRKKKKNITVISHVQESQMETVFGVLDVKKRKGREGRNRPNCHVSQCMSSKWSSSPPGRKTTSSFFFSSQESTTSGCSLTSFPPPPTLLLITCSFLLLFGCPQFPWRASFISDFCDPSRTRASILPARSNSLFSSCENETGAP